MRFVNLEALSAWVGEGDAGAAAEGGEEWGAEREAYLEMVALVLVGDQIGARERDIVAEAGRILVDMVACAEHVRFKFFAAFFEGFYCRTVNSTLGGGLFQRVAG